MKQPVAAQVAPTDGAGAGGASQRRGRRLGRGLGGRRHLRLPQRGCCRAWLLHRVAPGSLHAAAAAERGGDNYAAPVLRRKAVRGVVGPGGVRVGGGRFFTPTHSSLGAPLSLS